MTTVYFRFTIPKETFQNDEQVLSHATALIPTPQPPDLIISADDTNGVEITYSVTFASPQLAAAAIVKALKTEKPT